MCILYWQFTSHFDFFLSLIPTSTLIRDTGRCPCSIFKTTIMDCKYQNFLLLFHTNLVTYLQYFDCWMSIEIKRTIIALCFIYWNIYKTFIWSDLIVCASLFALATNFCQMWDLRLLHKLISVPIVEIKWDQNPKEIIDWKINFMKINLFVFENSKFLQRKVAKIKLIVILLDIVQLFTFSKWFNFVIVSTKHKKRKLYSMLE